MNFINQLGFTSQKISELYEETEQILANKRFILNIKSINNEEIINELQDEMTKQLSLPISCTDEEENTNNDEIESLKTTIIN